MARGDGIKPINALFAKYHNTLKPPQKHVVDTFCEVVEDVVGVTLVDSKVKYTPYNKTLVLSVSGAVKSEILLNKKDILNHLKGRLGTQSAPTEII